MIRRGSVTSKNHKLAVMTNNHHRKAKRRNSVMKYTIGGQHEK